LDELTPIANMTSGAQLFVASEDSSIDSIDDLIDYAQKNPKELDVGISGKENLQHVSFESFAEESDIEVNYVTYDDDSGTMSGVLKGDADIGLLEHTVAKENIEAGKLKAIANYTDVKPSYLEDVPTLKDEGFDTEAVFFYGLIAP